jgi:hypothetical protein
MSPHKINSLTVALWTVAALLLANLIAAMTHSDAPALLPAANAQRQAPIAGGGGLFIMPAQLSSNNWGAYLMDIDHGTLCVYQYLPGTKQLQFVSARKFTSDTKLENFNTSPSPQEIADLVDKQNKAIRSGAATPSDEISTQKDK